MAQAGSNYKKNWRSKITLDCPWSLFFEILLLVQLFHPSMLFESLFPVQMFQVLSVLWKLYEYVQLFQVQPVLRKPVPCSVVSVKSVLWKPLPCSAVLSKYICFVKAWSLFSCSKISLFCKILFPVQLCWTARGTCWMEMMDWKCSHSSTPRNRKCLLQRTFFTTVIIINCTNNV